MYITTCTLLQVYITTSLQSLKWHNNNITHLSGYAISIPCKLKNLYAFLKSPKFVVIFTLTEHKNYENYKNLKMRIITLFVALAWLQAPQSHNIDF